MICIIIGAVVVLILLYVMITYNGLVKLRNAVKDQWAQIESALKRRADLIPNLVETVKGYAKHEKGTLTEVIEARNKVVSAGNPADEMKANGELTQALNKLMVLTENYPDLKANENFQALQAELKDSEDKIYFARNFYNDSAMVYKNKLEMFPSNIVASMFKFEPMEFFEAEEADRKVPNVKF